MKYLLLAILITTTYADIFNITSFEADFKQNITDENNKTITYTGSLKALKPNYALWHYKTPIEKSVYIDTKTLTVVEPELEQVLIKHIDEKLDFFTILQKAQKREENLYTTEYKNMEIVIKTESNKILSLGYKDEFDNIVELTFENQIENAPIEEKLFTPSYPLTFDTLRD